MSEAKHAPGPWSENRYGEVMDVTGTPVVFSPGFSIGSVTGHPERASNKTLAMTAPELLESLKAATDALAGGLWDYGPGQDEHEKCNEVIEACRAVIAKATE